MKYLEFFTKILVILKAILQKLNFPPKLDNRILLSCFRIVLDIFSRPSSVGSSVGSSSVKSNCSSSGSCVSESSGIVIDSIKSSYSEISSPSPPPTQEVSSNQIVITVPTHFCFIFKARKQ